MNDTSTRADLIVIGLGAMGSATADAAARRGLRVIGLEAFEQGHRRGSSHGATRIIRRSIEEGPQYVPLVLDALARWRQLDEESDQPILHLGGAIRVAPAGSALHAAFLRSAVAHHLDFERLQPGDVHERFPALVVPDGFEALFEQDAGVVFADRAVRALQTRAVRHGASLQFDEPVSQWRADGDGVVVDTPQATYRGDRLVITAGAWTTQLLASLALPLVVQRVVNVTFQPTVPQRFDHEHLPAFLLSDGTSGVYGVPAIGGEGVKVGGSGSPTSPDETQPPASDDEVTALRSVVDRFLPGAASSDRSTLTCLYTTAPDGHFVIDHHPDHPQVVVASPCSGHGFKYTTAIGPVLVDLAVSGSASLPIDSFGISRFITSGAVK
ncbi:MAG: N-methyl-L-tryptophan oxidase [Actinobacteria bacterium]|nr:N-methyl-L-tryptophan oxidase [Actinomycetota bacterium]